MQKDNWISILENYIKDQLKQDLPKKAVSYLQVPKNKPDILSATTNNFGDYRTGLADTIQFENDEGEKD